MQSRRSTSRSRSAASGRVTSVRRTASKTKVGTRKASTSARTDSNVRQLKPPTINCVIAGFNAFGSFATNPSQLAVARLPDSCSFDDRAGSADLRITKAVLPTCCTEGFAELQRAVRKVKSGPFIVVLSGVAQSRDLITVERFAVNVRHYRIPDNSGHQWFQEHIIKSEQDALRTHVDLNKIARHLNRRGFPTDVSNSAGSFVCNETYFKALHKWGDNPRCLGILFVHLPEPALYAATLQEMGVTYGGRAAPVKRRFDTAILTTKPRPVASLAKARAHRNPATARVGVTMLSPGQFDAIIEEFALALLEVSAFMAL